MENLTGVERIKRVLQRKPADRIGIHEHIWSTTVNKWRNEGHLQKDERPETHFGLDIYEYNPFNYKTDPDAGFIVIDEKDDVQILKDGSGVLYRDYKNRVGGRQYFDFTIKEKADWDEKVKPVLKPERKRINFEGYRKARNFARENGLFFVCFGLNVFELMRSLCGHENMFIGAVIEPEWISDMVSAYSQLNCDLMEMLFSEEGEPDGIWFAEDLGYKEHPFISPAMYRELIKPGHIRTVSYVHSRGLPFIMHSCGYIYDLLPDIVDTGIDCLQALEVKAGMDLLKIYKEFGDKISLIGGIDTRVLSGGKDDIRRELESKIPIVKGNFGYVFHSDHSIPDNIEYDMYQYFVETALNLGKY